MDRMMSAYCDPTGEVSLQIELTFNEPLDREQLEHAVHLVIDSEPKLGCRLVPGEQIMAHWERMDDPYAASFHIVTDEAGYQNAKTTPLNVWEGPQFRACYLEDHADEGAPGAKLLMKVTHEAADATGLRRTATLVSELYTTLGQDPSFVPAVHAAKSTNFRELLRGLPLRALPKLLWSNLREKYTLAVPLATHVLPTHDADDSPVGFAERRLPEGSIEAMRAYGANFNASINDMMLAALVRAVATVGEWNGKDQLRICTSIDLRRHLSEDVAQDIVCNLSHMEALNLGRDLGDGFDETLEKVAAIMNKRKGSWMGMSLVPDAVISRYLPYRWLRALHSALMNTARKTESSPLVFANAGQIIPEDHKFGDQVPSEAWFVSTALYPPFHIVGISRYQGTATLTAGVSDPAVRLPVIEALFDEVIKELPIPAPSSQS